jgi:hypothetical protein
VTDRRSPLIVAGPSESLADVLNRLAAGKSAGPADLVVPRDSGLLLTAGEFRELRDVMDRDRLSITLYCDDSMRRQLAELMGLPCRRIPPGWLAAARPAPARPEPAGAVAAASPGAAAVLTPEPRPALPEARLDPMPSRPEWADPLPSRSGKNERALPPAVAIVPPEAEETGPGFDQIVDRRHRGGRGIPRWLGFAVGALLLLALGAVALALLMPRASIALALQHAPVAGTVTFDVTSTGAPLDDLAAISLAAKPLETEIVFETTIPVTGIRRIPDTPAAAVVEFANVNPEPALVPADAELDGGAMTFVLEEEIEVPAADPATGVAGNASARVSATAPGSEGNVGVGEIGGRLAEGVYYSNRGGAADGGSDIELPIVSAEDLAVLRAEAEAALAPGASAFGQLPAGTRLLAQTVEVLGGDETFTAQEGEEAETVGIAATRQVRGLGYDEAAAMDEIRRSAPTVLATSAPDGFEIAPESVTVTAIESISDQPQGSRFAAAVDADAVAAFTTSDARALAERLAGTDPESADSVLAATPGLAGYEIDYQAGWLPDWLPKRMPNDPRRIEIEISR